MNAVVFGYREFGCAGLDALLRHGIGVELVVTHADADGEQQAWPALAERAKAYGIAVATPESARDPALLQQLAKIAPNFLFCFYYRQLLPAAALRCARNAALNLHGSLLPRLRGRAPLNWALVLGETETGVTLHYMTGRADAGDIVDQERVPVFRCDTAYTLSLELLRASQTLLDRALPLLIAGRSVRVAQDDALATYVGARRPADGRIDWTQPASTLFDLVRAVTHPYPGAFTSFAGQPLFIWWALPQTLDYDAAPGTVVELSDEGVVVATGRGSLRLITVRFADGPESPAAALAPRIGLRPGRKLGGDTP